MADVQCLECRRISNQGDLKATSWDCVCGSSYVFRHCSGCGIVSQVGTLQRNGQPWDCMWCRAPNSGFTMRKDPATATIGNFADDMVRRELAFHPLPTRAVAQPPAQTEPMLIVTMNEVPGYRIIKVHGDVFGLVVRSRSYFANLGAQFAGIAGGEVVAYTKLLADSRNQARARMWQEARERGANAVVAMRFDCNEIGTIMSEVAAYGTAVTVEPVDLDQHG